MCFSLYRCPEALQILYIFKVNIALGNTLPKYTEFLFPLSAFFRFNLSPLIKKGENQECIKYEARVPKKIKM